MCANILPTKLCSNCSMLLIWWSLYAGLYAQQFTKKPKTLKQSPESSPKALATLGGSLASQINKIANSNKIMKVIPNRGKKPKAKVRHLLVYSDCWISHDIKCYLMTINSSLLFKCCLVNWFLLFSECSFKHCRVLDLPEFK